MTSIDSTGTTARSREVVTAVYKAGAGGDVETLLGLMADDLVVEEPWFLPYGGTYETPQGLAELFGKIGAVLDVTQMQIDYLVCDADHVIGIIRIPDRRTGHDVLLAEESTVRDGKVARMRIFFHDTQSLIGAPRC
jgi:ketosteroid isomerase-like protein